MKNFNGGASAPSAKTAPEWSGYLTLSADIAVVCCLQVPSSSAVRLYSPWLVVSATDQPASEFRGGF